MGVRGLPRFLKEHCSSDVCCQVNVAELVLDYKIKTGRNAKIVVDAQSCYSLWYRDMNWAVGYEVQKYIIRLRDFVESFQKLNVQLVYFFGGSTSEEKRKAWFEKRLQNIAETHDAIDGRLQDEEKFRELLRILPNIGFTTALILKYVLDCEVHMAIDECDEEIIAYAQEHECFAILSRDTDFIISQVNAVVLTPANFETKKMTTHLYDRTKLAQKLEIRTEELPLLAIIAGNNLIHVNEIKEFHHCLCPRKKRNELTYRDLLMPTIASYINQLPRNESIEETLAHLAVEMFNDASRVNLLKTSYYSYFVKTTNKNPAPAPTDAWSKILHAATDRYRNGLLSSLAYFALTKEVLHDGTTFEDLRVTRRTNPLTRTQPSSTVLRPLRSRLYGILFAEKDGQIPIIREWCNEDNRKSYQEPVEVEPITPEVHHPGLMALWSDDEEISEVRWILFLTTISPSLNAAQWQSFDEGFLLSTLSAFHLYDTKYVNETELNTILVTIACYSLYDVQKYDELDFRWKTLKEHHYLNSRRFLNLDFRAVNITITLHRAFTTIVTLLGACGNPVKLTKNNSYLKFEAKLFQVMYTDVIKKEADIESLCGNNDDCLKLFTRMKKLIIGIEDDQDINYEFGEMHVH